MSYGKLDIERFKQRNDNKNPRTQFLALARLAEMSQRYDDMCMFMREVVLAAADGPDLTYDERNLLSIAYQNAIGSRRQAWRSINIDEYYCAESMVSFAKKLEDEIQSLCLGIIELIDKVLLHHPFVTEDSLIFYYKLIGDYYRYLSELKLPQDPYPEKSAMHYKEGMDIASRILPPHDPIRLGLALNYSVCLYEIVKRCDDARTFAKRIYDEAIIGLKDHDQQQYKDAKLILNLLRDNLSLWGQVTGTDE